MAAATSPTVLRWELAARLRDLRLGAGKSIEDAAKELMCSPAKISRLETGGRGIQARDVRDLCRFYGVSDRVRDTLIQMATDAKRQGWWQDYRSLDEQTSTFLGLEAAASSILMLESRVVPGLLQTSAYSRLLLEGILVPPLSPEEVGEMVEVRQRRRERVTRGQVSLMVVVDEAVIARTYDRADIMEEQIDQLVADAQLSNVKVQVIPFTAKPHPGIHGSFAHLAFADRAVADLVYVEGLGGNSIVDREVDVQRYVAAYHESRRLSLSPEDTLSWLQAKKSSRGHKPRGRTTGRSRSKP